MRVAHLEPGKVTVELRLDEGEVGRISLALDRTFGKQDHQAQAWDELYQRMGRASSRAFRAMREPDTD